MNNSVPAWKWTALLLIIITISARLGFMFFWGGLDNQLRDSMSDQKIYIDIATNLSQGKGFIVSVPTWIADVNVPTSVVPPVYPLFLAGCFLLFGKSLLAVRLIQVLFSIVTVLLVFLLGWQLFNFRTGMIAGVIAALYPALVMYPRPIMSESLFFPLLVLLAWLTYRLTQPATGWITWAFWGLVGGVAIETRSEALFLVVLLMVYLLFKKLRQKEFQVLNFTAATGLLVICLLPFSLYNLQHHGRFSPLPNAAWKLWDHTYWAEMRTHPEWAGVILPEQIIVPDWNSKTEIQRDTYLFNMAVDFIVHNPKIYAIQRIKRLQWSYPVIPLEALSPPLGNKGISSPPDGAPYGPTSLDDVNNYTTPAEIIRVWFFRLIILLDLGGLYLLIRRRQWQASWLLLLFIGWNIIDSMVYVGSERIRLQIEPFLFLLGSWFLAELASRVVTRRTPAVLARESIQ